MEAVNVNNRHLTKAEFVAYVIAALKARGAAERASAAAAKTTPGAPQ